MPIKPTREKRMTSRGDSHGMTTAKIARLRDAKTRRNRLVATACAGMLGLAGLAMAVVPHAQADGIDGTVVVDAGSGKSFLGDADAQRLAALGQLGQGGTPALATESAQAATRPGDDEVALRAEAAQAEAELVDGQEADGLAAGGRLVVTPSAGATADSIREVAEAAGMGVEAVAGDAGMVILQAREGTSIGQARAEILASGEVAGCEPDLVLHPADDGEAQVVTDMAELPEVTIESTGAGAATLGIEGDEEPELVAMASSDGVSDSFDGTVDDTLMDGEHRWDYEELGMLDAWALARSDRKVTVAVIDDGFDTGHIDLRNVVIDGWRVARDGDNHLVVERGDAAGLEPVNGSGHGTHVAGVISAEAGNGFGVAGISYNANLLPIQIGEEGRATSLSSLVLALDELCKLVIQEGNPYNVRVVNISLEVPFIDNETMDQLTQNQNYMQRIALDIKTLRQKGVTIVAAAGNSPEKVIYANRQLDGSARYRSVTVSGAYTSFPAALDDVIGVMALREGDGGATASDRSNQNHHVDGESAPAYQFAMPGEHILSTWPYGADGGRDPHAFAYASGSSCAAAELSGTAALLYARAPYTLADMADDMTTFDDDDQVVERGYQSDVVTALLRKGAKDVWRAGPDVATGWGEPVTHAVLDDFLSTHALNKNDILPSAIPDSTNIIHYDLSRANSSLLADIGLSIDGYELNGFDYRQKSYSISYNEPRDEAPPMRLSWERLDEGMVVLSYTVKNPDGTEKLIVSQPITDGDGTRYRTVTKTVISFVSSPYGQSVAWSSEDKEDDRKEWNAIGIYIFEITYKQLLPGTGAPAGDEDVVDPQGDADGPGALVAQGHEDGGEQEGGAQSAPVVDLRDPTTLAIMLKACMDGEVGIRGLSDSATQAFPELKQRWDEDEAFKRSILRNQDKLHGRGDQGQSVADGVRDQKDFQDAMGITVVAIDPQENPDSLVFQSDDEGVIETLDKLEACVSMARNHAATTMDEADASSSYEVAKSLLPLREGEEVEDYIRRIGYGGTPDEFDDQQMAAEEGKARTNLPPVDDPASAGWNLVAVTRGNVTMQGKDEGEHGTSWTYDADYMWTFFKYERDAATGKDKETGDICLVFTTCRWVITQESVITSPGNTGGNVKPQAPAESAYEQLRTARVVISGVRLQNFSYDKTYYEIDFAEGLSLPAAPSFTDLPGGWVASPARTTSLPKAGKTPLGGTKNEVTLSLLSTESVSRTYTFDYVYVQPEAPAAGDPAGGGDGGGQSTTITDLTPGELTAVTAQIADSTSPTVAATSATKGAQAATEATGGSGSGNGSQSQGAAQGTQGNGSQAAASATQGGSESQAGTTGGAKAQQASGPITQTGDAVAVTGLMTMAAAAGGIALAKAGKRRRE